MVFTSIRIFWPGVAPGIGLVERITTLKLQVSRAIQTVRSVSVKRFQIETLNRRNQNEKDKYKSGQTNWSPQNTLWLNNFVSTWPSRVIWVRIYNTSGKCGLSRESQKYPLLLLIHVLYFFLNLKNTLFLLIYCPLNRVEFCQGYFFDIFFSVIFWLSRTGTRASVKHKRFIYSVFTIDTLDEKGQGRDTRVHVTL